MLKRVQGSLRPNLAVKNRMAKKDQSDRKFESALEELEGVIEQLESGNLSLEDSLAAFEKGVGLVKYCNQKLSEVEQKVELLIKDKEGRLQLKLLDSLVNPEGKDEENE
jgi:exodeoxyribonuclease VII small subunit